MKFAFEPGLSVSGVATGFRVVGQGGQVEELVNELEQIFEGVFEVLGVLVEQEVLVDPDKRLHCVVGCAAVCVCTRFFI